MSEEKQFEIKNIDFLIKAVYEYGAKDLWIFGDKGERTHFVISPDPRPTSGHEGFWWSGSRYGQVIGPWPWDDTDDWRGY